VGLSLSTTAIFDYFSGYFFGNFAEIRPVILNYDMLPVVAL